MRLGKIIKTAGWALAAMVAPGVCPAACDPPADNQQPTTNDRGSDMHRTKRVKIKTALIEDWPEVNPREDYNAEAMDLLFASIDEGGLVEAIKVNLCTEIVGDGSGPIETYKLIDGKGRLTAVRKANLETVEVELYYDLPVAAALDIVSSACLQRAFNIVEQCRHISRLVDADRSPGYIARTMGMSESTVTKRLAIDGLPDEVKDMMIRDHNALPIHQALLLVDLDVDDQIDFAWEIAPETGKVMTEAEARDYIKEKTAPPTPLIDPGQGMGQALVTVEETDSADNSEYTMNSTGSGPGPKPISEPKPGSAKDPNQTGLRRELAGVMTVQGTFDISRGGVLIRDAQITCEAGVVSVPLDMDRLVLDLDEAGVKQFQDFGDIEAEALAEAEA